MAAEIKHILLKGINRSEIESIPYESQKIIRLGRAAENDVIIENIADSVSRTHAEIIINKLSYKIVDLNSTNGLYVNDMKVTEQEIFPGDRIKLGQQGPEFEFDLDPRPATTDDKTRLIEIKPATKEVSTFEVSDEIISNIDRALSGHSRESAVGKDTIERMIKTGQKKNRALLKVVGAVAVAAVALLVYISFGGSKLKNASDTVVSASTSSLNSADIAQKYGKAIVKIQNAYKLVYTPTGEDIYHLYDTINGIPRAIYLRNTAGEIEPLCVTGKSNPWSKLLAGVGQGTGFVANPEGYIVTNRHVANTWMDTYQFPAGAFPGVLIVPDGAGSYRYQDNFQVSAYHVQSFIPIQMTTLDRSPIISKEITGELFYTDVLFSGSSNPISAEVNRVSNTHDVAILKINSPSRLLSAQLKSVELSQGKDVMVMGYPGASSNQIKTIESKSIFDQNRKYSLVANPSIFNGIVSKNASSIQNLTEFYSDAGDSYELTITAGPGTSGGPLFNDEGFVVGVYYASRQGDTPLSLALPISYATDLLTVQ